MPIFLNSGQSPHFDTHGVDSQLQPLPLATCARNARTCWKVSMSAMITYSCHAGSLSRADQSFSVPAFSAVLSASWAKFWAPCSCLVSHLLVWPCSRHPCPPRRRVLDFRSWTRRGCALESAAVRVGRGAGRRMFTSLMDGGMDHGPNRDHDGSGLEVVVDDMPLQQLEVRLTLHWCHDCGGIVYHRPCGAHGAAQNPYRRTAGQGSVSWTEVGGRPTQMSSSTETRSALPTLQKPLEDTPFMSRRSAFLSWLLDQHSSPHAHRWFIGCRCRVSTDVQGNSHSLPCQAQKKCSRHATNYLHCTFQDFVRLVFSTRACVCVVWTAQLCRNFVFHINDRCFSVNMNLLHVSASDHVSTNHYNPYVMASFAWYNERFRQSAYVQFLFLVVFAKRTACFFSP